MNCYEIWVDLAPGVKDLELVTAVENYLGALKNDGKIELFRIKRRKFGFGPEALGEFWISIETKDLAQLDDAFHTVVPREGEMEKLHAAVFSRITNYKSGLWRDFPDPERTR
ncbi:MAG: hypothetical protein KDC26_06765 [Armatimonadetes bacterium]|nr:hypothetical protein [Armatimonadota bacterium]